MNEITKEQAINGIGDAVALAGLLKITPQAIYQWPDGPIPEKRQWQLQLLRPDIFGPPPTEPPVQAEGVGDVV